MGDDLVFRKLVDMSVIKEGMGIPASVQDTLFEKLGCHIQQGESCPIQLHIGQESFDAILKNQDYDKVKHPDRVDVVQIRYSSNSDFAVKLRTIFPATTQLVNQYIAQRTDKQTQLIIPEDQREYIEFYTSHF